MKDATFSSARLLELYDRISDAEDAIPNLRRVVLDLAVRGKLVEQNASDEPADELLKRVAQEKARLVKSKEIRKLKVVEPISTDEGLDLPASWLQARLGELSILITKGSTPTSYGHEYTSSGVSFVKVESIVKGLLSVATISSFISPETHEFLSRSQLATGDILFSIAGTIGTCALVGPEVLPANTNQALAIIRGTGLCFAPDFLITILRSRVADAIQKKARGGAMNNVSLQDIQNVVMPLPPLAEQHRIVAKVDELMALCDQLEQARAGREAVRDRLTTASLARLTAPDTDAETFQSHARFAMQSLSTLTTRNDQIKTLRQTILNLAVQGRLVAQDPSEGNGHELLGALRKSRMSDKRGGRARREIEAGEISAEEEYLDVPASWAWMRVADAGTTQTGTSPSSSVPELFGNFVPFIKPGDLDGKQIDYSGPGLTEAGMAQSRVAPERTVLMVCIGATLGKVNVTDRTVCFNQQINSVTPYPDLNHLFVALALKAQGFQGLAWTKAGTGTLPIISKGKWEVLPIPLPPLAEQHRIVARVDALMALCDQLESSLTTTTTTRSKLLNVLLHEALAPGAAELEVEQ